MSEEMGFVRVRMLIVKYSSKFEIRDMGSGVILIKEPLIELMTDEDLVCMGFGC